MPGDRTPATGKEALEWIRGHARAVERKSPDALAREDARAILDALAVAEASHAALLAESRHVLHVLDTTGKDDAIGLADRLRECEDSIRATLAKAGGA